MNLRDTMLRHLFGNPQHRSRQRTRRRGSPFVAAVAALAMGAAACGSATESTSAEQGSATTDEANAVATGGESSLTMLLPAGTIADTVQPIVDDFASESGVQVDTIVLPVNDLRARQVLTLNNQNPELDLLILDDSWVSEVATHLEPLNELVSEDDVEGYIPTMVDAFELDGNQYALPYVMSVRTIIYRADLFDEAGLDGPPETYDEMREYAEALTTGDVHGFVGPWGNGETYVNVWANIASNFGLEGILDEDLDEAVFNTEAGVEAARLMGDLYKNGWMPPDSLELAHEHVNRAMLEGRAAMTILPTVFFDPLNDPENSPHAGEFRLAPLPQGPGVQQDRYITTGFGWAMSKYSEDKDAAWQLIQFINDRYRVPGEDAPRLQLNSPASDEAFQHPGVKEIFFDGQEQLVRDMLSQATIRPQTPRWGDVSNALAEAIQGVFLGELTAEEAMNQAEARVNEILSGS